MGFSTYLSLSSADYETSCANVQSFNNILRINDSNLQVPSMPGISISMKLGVCDAFGQIISTLQGGSISYVWINISSVDSQIVRTSSSNGTGAVQTRIPVVHESGKWISFQTRVSGEGSSSFPPLSLMWTTSSCAAFFGFSETSGCSLCPPNQFSIASSFLPCNPCENLDHGASCQSVPISDVPLSSQLASSIPNSDSLSVTVITISDGYWPSLSLSSISTIVPIPCPLDYCSRSGKTLYVVGENAEGTLAKTSDPSLVCRQGAFRNPSSPLCGECIPGFVDWNNECYHCPNGPQPKYIILFIFLVFGWTFVQLILAQQGGSGTDTAMLFFMTQSLTWFTYPRGVLHTVENLVNFRFHFSSVDECYIDVDGSIELFLRTIVPMLYFVALWILYGVHLIIAWSLSRQNSESIASKSSESPPSIWKKASQYLKSVLITSATTDPYQRTTALLLLSTYPSILNSIFSVWSCVDVPVFLFYSSFILFLLFFLISVHFFIDNIIVILHPVSISFHVKLSSFFFSY